jgi:biofilm PGA synthesis N-glycosyltransferase PgaC
MNTNQLSYVLVTPARNEERIIEQTIRSVISQTVLPQKWVIVSDGSTDRTDDIALQYSAKHQWIELVRMPEHRDGNFGAKVQCFNAGYRCVLTVPFDIIANLDADITFGPDYFEFLLSKLAADPNLGVTGTPFVENGVSYDYRFTSSDHVSGACQVFRRECFEDIGGYVPVKGGGIDWIAVTTARMKGWKTQTFVERVCEHHRPMGTANAGRLMANFKLGKQDFYLGGHPLWQVFRGCYQMVRAPYVVGGAYLIAGYFWAWMSRASRPVPSELIRFHQQEQLQRLRRMLMKAFTFRAVREAR